MQRRELLIGLTALSALTLAGCGDKKAETEIKLGTLSGPHAEVAEVAAKVAAAKGLKIKIVEFSDYGHVNEALAAKDIDVNAFQHVPYLNKAIAQKGYPFTPLGKTVLFPLGVYSLKIHSINEITDGMLVTVPADPANLGRALQLLERNGLITLRAGTGVHATTRDIIASPKHLKFLEVDSAYLGRSLSDVGFAVINGSWAVKSNLSPAKDAFILEDGKSDFANVLVVRTEDKDKAVFKTLQAAFQSPEVKQFVLDKFKGSVVPAF